MNERGDALEKGFRLAYFIFPERSVALKILSGAYNKLHSQCRQARKRNYWRDKYLKRWITRISASEADTLQWLICFESDAYEKQQEHAGRQSLHDMVRRFLKTLVRSGTAMSSFYVNAGIGRLLHSYTTTETQQAYEVVSERYLGADEYRRAKRILMNKLEMRFAGFLTTVKSGYGEVRFEMLDEQKQWEAYVHKCLAAFVPWSTQNECLVPRSFVAANGLPHLLTGKSLENTKSDAVETNRCHAFIDPTCYERLMVGLGFEAPLKKLSLPRFNMTTDQRNDNPPDNHAGLTRQERQEIESMLVGESDRRRRATPQIARVLVDGVERQKLDLQEQNELRFDIAAGAELIEIWAQDQVASGKAVLGQSEFLLATHKVRYDAGNFVADSQTIALKAKKALVLSIVPYATAAEGEEHRAGVSLKFADPAMSEDVAALLSRSRYRIPAYAFAAAVCLALGWGFGMLIHSHEINAERSTIASLEKQLAVERALHGQQSQTPNGAVPVYKLISDDQYVRGAGSLEPSVVTIAAGQPLAALQLPIGNSSHIAFHAAVKPFLGGPEIMGIGELKVEQTASGNVVTLPLPASLVSDGQDYVVDLRYLNAAGRLEELNTFTFHVIKRMR